MTGKPERWIGGTGNFKALRLEFLSPSTNLQRRTKDVTWRAPRPSVAGGCHVEKLTNTLGKKTTKRRAILQSFVGA